MKTKIAILLLLISTAFILAAGHPGGAPSLAVEQDPLLDDDALKARLQERIWGDNDNIYQGWTPWDMAIWFRQEAGNPSDERMYSALTAIYREAAEQEGGGDAQDLMTRAVLWLGVCSNNATKAFLLEAAADTSKDGFLRTTALSSYLRNANAEETKDVLIRFLVTPNRIDNDMDRSEIYTFAYTAWQHSSPEKKMAICEALQVGLAHETPHWVFCSGDGWLSRMSAKYASSKERLAMFERMYATPVPDGELFDKRSLIPQLKMMRKLNVLNNINTNLSVLKERDFNQPLPEEERIALEMPRDTPVVVGSAQETPSRRAHKGLHAVAVITGLLIAFALWLGIRRKRGTA